MKTTPLPLLALLLVSLPVSLTADDEGKSTLVKTGEKAPEFSCKTLDGKEFSLGNEKGKVILVNFFATWCGPCVAEMPHLEKELYQKFKNHKDFRLIAIGREQGSDVLEPFRKKHKLTFPVAGDPKREIYARYAEKYIPRNFIIGKDGKVKLASVGFTEKDFKKILETIEKELGK